MKHLVVIHGRATKPSKKEKQRLIKSALLHGLGRVSSRARSQVKTGKVKLSIIYYGDINNREMMKAGKKSKADLKGRDSAFSNAPCEEVGSYDSDLQILFQRTSFSKTAYKRFLKEEKDNRLLDNAASALSGVLNIIGLSDNIIKAATPDMGAYMRTREVGSEVRERLQKVLKPALKRGDDVCLVAHSMGCIVSYDVLWKFSRMSEYSSIRDRKLTKWITIGCPLGEPGVKDNLYDSNEGDDGKYPTNIDHWVNISAKDDFVAHDEDIGDDFKEMKRRRYLRTIEDKEIYNFWSGYSGSNPHKHYGYLDHPTTAKELADWIN